MNTGNDEETRSAVSNQSDSPTECGPQCNCSGSSVGMKAKVTICVLVAIAAGVVLVRGLMSKDSTEADRNQKAFAVELPVAKTETSSATNEELEGKKRKQGKSSLWGSPLDSLASLNERAAEKDAVFVFLPGKDPERSQVIREQIEAAAIKAQSRGTAMAAYRLGKDSRDYTQITGRTPAPCVLVKVKGRGQNVVADSITEAKLLEALVAASRPSECCPGRKSSGCKK
jgi:hypothetical protein